METSQEQVMIFFLEDVEMYMRDSFPIEAWLKGETDPNNFNFDPNARIKNLVR